MLAMASTIPKLLILKTILYEILLLYLPIQFIFFHAFLRQPV